MGLNNIDITLLAEFSLTPIGWGNLKRLKHDITLKYRFTDRKFILGWGVIFVD
jgi:hypothetical protein